MRVLVACEFSGTVRDAFLRAGHYAMSADLLPSESPLGDHYRGDVTEVLDDGWDLMVAHPPCTYLCLPGIRWLHEKPGRWSQMEDAAMFFYELLHAPIPRVAVENPVMHPYAAHAIGQRQAQILRPWEFGHLESKGIALWLRGLPPLVPTTSLRAETHALPAKVRMRNTHLASPGPDRWKVRSRTYPGLAAAMAAQWGSPALAPPTPDVARAYEGISSDRTQDRAPTPVLPGPGPA